MAPKFDINNPEISELISLFQAVGLSQSKAVETAKSPNNAASLKDIIISGGENISSIEVENVLYKLAAIESCAVVAAPDDKWGEIPIAFIEIYDGSTLTRDEVVSHCRAHLAGFKVPKHVIFTQIPKTSTGKVQKFELRQAAKSLAHETPKVK